MNTWRQFAEETKIEGVQRMYESWERGLAMCSKEFSSGNSPEMREILFLMTYDAMMV